MLVVESEAEQHVGVFELPEVRALEQVLVFLDRTPDLPLLPIEVAEDEMYLERIPGGFGRGAQFLNRWIDLVGDQEIEAEHVVRRFPRAAAVDPAAVLQLVALPGLADG